MVPASYPSFYWRHGREFGEECSSISMVPWHVNKACDHVNILNIVRFVKWLVHSILRGGWFFFMGTNC